MCGGINNYDSSATVKNCIFSGNGASAGGGLVNFESSTTIINCTFSGNYADQGGGICNFAVPAPGVSNCVLWGDIAPLEPEIFGDCSVSFSDVQGGYSGDGNIDADPCFVDAAGGNYHLQSQAGRWDPSISQWVTDVDTSVCIDAGDPNSDWTAELWPHGKCINMGVYGGTPEASMSLLNIGNIADLDNNGRVDSSDLDLLTGKWLYEQFLLAEDLSRDGIVNFLDFAMFADNWLWE